MLVELVKFVLAVIIGASTSELIRALSARGEANRRSHGRQPLVRRSQGR